MAPNAWVAVDQCCVSDVPDTVPIVPADLLSDRSSRSDLFADYLDIQRLFPAL